MPNELSRRTSLKLAAVPAAGNARASAISLFDGKTLDGWIQIENSATSLSTAGITDPAAFRATLAHGSDAISIFLRDRLPKSVETDLDSKTAISALVKDLNQVIAGPSI